MQLGGRRKETDAWQMWRLKPAWKEFPLCLNSMLRTCLSAVFYVSGKLVWQGSAVDFFFIVNVWFAITVLHFYFSVSALDIKTQSGEFRWRSLLSAKEMIIFQI